MKTKDKVISLFITLVLSVLVFFVGANSKTYAQAVNVYEVYLNGKTIGLLDSKENFLKLVDQKQQEIKDKYGVSKVYPPTGLKIEEVATYNENIKTSEEIYNIIENKEPFTIDGYTVTIKYKDKEKSPIYIHMLKKEDFETAFYDTMSAFIGTEALDAYKNKTQAEITETGTKIESIYWNEDITIKEDYISTENYIFTNAADLSKYLLFGTVDRQKEYIVKDGDSIENIINENSLSIEEFLIANPTIPNKNVLLTANQVVSIGLISPVVTIMNDNQVVEDIVNKYTTEYQEDSNLTAGTKKVLQQGSNGLNRVTERIIYKNGAIEDLVIMKTTAITPTVNEIIVRGTKTYGGDYSYINTGSESWYWPTTSPYIITSHFGYRWGSLHKGIDISGSGFGSPIRSATDGTVTEVYKSCANYGYYGSQCGGEYGNYVRILTSDGTYSIYYAHMCKNITVNVGDKVSRGQIIGSMGDSGSSTGTHLHFQINNASSGSLVNPCRGPFSC